MINFSSNKAENDIINIVYETLYNRLDEIKVPKDCPTRKMSWDEAAMECWDLAGEQETEIELIYKQAIQVYCDASNLWEAITEANELFIK